MITETQAQTAAQPLPVFYSDPEAMNPARQAGLHLRRSADYGFAAGAHAIPLAAAEMPAAMRSYPIVFVGADHAPVAIVGLQQSENLFVDTSGAWAGSHYVPAYVRRYPFILAGDAGAERLTLCIDRGSDRILSEAGEASDPLFDGETPSEATRRALAFCEEYNTLHNATRAVVEQIAGHGLFVDRRSRVSLPDGSVFNLTDFQVIDEAAFNALPDAAFLELRASGALPLIYCHLASMNSWASLIERAAGLSPMPDAQSVSSRRSASGKSQA